VPVVFTWDLRLLSIDGAGEERQDEQLGSKDKYWVVGLEDETPRLIKFARVRDGQTRGEDWAEWCVQHLAEMLHLPHAEVMPVEVNGRRAIASKSVIRVGSSQRLVHGNELLSEADNSYDPTIQRENPGYTVRAVFDALHGVGAPISFGGPKELNGFDVWAGYLLLDAWVAGRDRHHENWAIISELDRKTLSPTYDHGNALGCYEDDASRARYVANELLLHKWCSQGKSHHFAGRPSLVDVAVEAIELSSEWSRKYWRDVLNSIDWQEVESIFDAVPSNLMSEVGAIFAQRLLKTNVRRLLNVYPSD
jgi:hypothetical protein